MYCGTALVYRRALLAALFGALFATLELTTHLPASAEETFTVLAAIEEMMNSPGASFREPSCPDCPEMVVLPAGKFKMGSRTSRLNRESPRHSVTIPAPFAVGKYEVTRKEFLRFVEATDHAMEDMCVTHEDDKRAWRLERGWLNPGYTQGDHHPVVCVSWNDAQAYVGWLSQQTGHQYRLLSEAEWEYAARAGTQSTRYWGGLASEQCAYANGLDLAAVGFLVEVDELRIYYDRRGPCSDGSVHTATVGSYVENEFGLHDMIGNVAEWTEDCWNDTFDGAPSDGSAWVRNGDCSKRVIRGGAWDQIPMFLRSASRFRRSTANVFDNLGFRVARSLTQ